MLAIIQDAPTNRSNWVSEFNRLMKLNLIKLIPDIDFCYWSELGDLDNFRKKCENLGDRKILLGNTHFEMLPELLNVKESSKIYGHLHTMPGSMFEPYMYKHPEFDAVDRMVEKIGVCFLNSYAQVQEAKRNELDINGFRVGFPIDSYELLKYSSPKEDRLIVFNQRLSLEKNVALICLVSKELVKLGYKVEILRGDETNHDGAIDSYVVAIARSGATIRTLTKEMYWKRLSEAKCVIHTSAFDSFSVAAAEALVLGTNLVCPRAQAYPEIFPDAYFYEPYLLDDIILAAIKAENSGRPDPYSELWDPNAVFEKYAKIILG